MPLSLKFHALSYSLLAIIIAIASYLAIAILQIVQELLDSHEVQSTYRGTDWAGIGSDEGSAGVTGGKQTKTGSGTAEIGI